MNAKSNGDQPSLDKVIHEYLNSIRVGERPEQERLIADHPHLTEQLRNFFADNDRLQQVIHGPRRASHGLTNHGQTAPESESERDRKFLLEMINTGAHESDDPCVDISLTRQPYVTRYQPSTIIGPYKLLHTIGVGGMGEVWMAEQETPVQRRVALKLVRADQSAKQVMTRFEAERQALAMMDHPNIARVLDAGETLDGQPYFAMELVRGIPITAYCDQNSLSIHERLALFAQICKAAHHAHQKGIIHRDLKPSNILVTQYDGKAVPKVIDFGLAKALQHHTRLTDTTQVTEHGRLFGTFRYMSPEQAEYDAPDVDTRSDVYSLGVVLYEVLTGSTPIERRAIEKVALASALNMIQKLEPPRPSERINASGDAVTGICQHRRIHPRKLTQLLRGEVDWIVMKALEKDRARRYETANDFSEDVLRFLNGMPVQARPPSTFYRLRKFVRRNRALAAGSIAFALLLVASTAISSIFAIAAAKARNSLESKQQQAATQLELLQSVLANLDPAKEGIDNAQLRQRLGENLRQTLEKLESMPNADGALSVGLFNALCQALGGLGFPQDALTAAESAQRIASQESVDQDLKLTADTNLYCDR